MQLRLQSAQLHLQRCRGRWSQLVAMPHSTNNGVGGAVGATPLGGTPSHGNASHPLQPTPDKSDNTAAGLLIYRVRCGVATRSAACTVDADAGSAALRVCDVSWTPQWTALPSSRNASTSTVPADFQSWREPGPGGSEASGQKRRFMATSAGRMRCSKSMASAAGTDTGAHSMPNQSARATCAAAVSHTERLQPLLHPHDSPCAAYNCGVHAAPSAAAAGPAPTNDAFATPAGSALEAAMVSLTASNWREADCLQAAAQVPTRASPQAHPSLSPTGQRRSLALHMEVRLHGASYCLTCMSAACSVAG